MGRRLDVGNLAWTVTEKDLLDVFSEAGKVDSGKVIIHRCHQPFAGLRFLRDGDR